MGWFAMRPLTSGRNLRLMAQIAQRLPENVQGEFYVDSTCIDCDACRQIAPATFRDHGWPPSVYGQPRTATDVHPPLMPLVPSPTPSIGSTEMRRRRGAPLPVPQALVPNTHLLV